MSLIKWTLAAAGTAMGLRYMSDRHRRRLAGQGSDAGFGDDGDTAMRAAQDDRDTARTSTDTAWSAPQGGGSSLTGASSASGLSGSSGLASGSTGLSGSGQDDLLGSGSDLPPGNPSKRF